MEKFLNDLGQENWEIPQLPPARRQRPGLHGLARRTTQKDWTLEDAAKGGRPRRGRQAARGIRGQVQGGAGQAAPAEEEGDTFLAEEKGGAEGDMRRPRDISRDDDPEAPEDEHGAAPEGRLGTSSPPRRVADLLRRAASAHAPATSAVRA
ncbi:MAG: hypothetical protein WDM96_10075 [Lacunisphaera sp.]